MIKIMTQITKNHFEEIYPKNTWLKCKEPQTLCYIQIEGYNATKFKYQVLGVLEDGTREMGTLDTAVVHTLFEEMPPNSISFIGGL